MTKHWALKRFALWCALVAAFTLLVVPRVTSGGLSEYRFLFPMVMLAGGVVLNALWLIQQNQRLGRAVLFGIVAGTLISINLPGQPIHHNEGLFFILLGLLTLNGIYFVVMRKRLKSEI